MPNACRLHSGLAVVAVSIVLAGFTAGIHPRPEGVSSAQDEVGLRVDTGAVERVVRHFYDLYTARDFDSLYARAHASLREKGMSASNFRQFMRKKRDRLGPARSVAVDVSDGGGTTITAVATVTFENGRQEERWQLVRENETVQWQSFRSSEASGGTSSDDSSGRAPLEVGARVPDVALPALRDSTRHTRPSDFKGTYVLVNFWATWCAPCIDKIPTQRTAVERYGEAFTLLNVSFDRTRTDAITFLSENSLPGTHAYLGIRGFRDPVAESFGVYALPTSVLVGPDGRVVAGTAEIQSEGLLSILEREIGGD